MNLAPQCVPFITAAAALATAVFSLCQFNASQVNERRSQRAYVSVSEPRLDFEVGKPVSATATLQVFGLTPSYDMEIKYYLGGGDAKPKSIKEYEEANNYEKVQIHVFSVFPGQKIPLDISNSKWILDSSTFNNYSSRNNNRLYIVGQVTYNDIFKCSHTVDFCFAKVSDSAKPEQCGDNHVGKNSNMSDDPNPC